MENRYIVELVRVMKKIPYNAQASCEEVQEVINKYSKLGYKLHSFQTTCLNGGGYMDEHNLIFSLVFERE